VLVASWEDILESQLVGHTCHEVLKRRGRKVSEEESKLLNASQIASHLEFSRIFWLLFAVCYIILCRFLGLKFLSNIYKEARINPRQIWSSSRIGTNFNVHWYWAISRQHWSPLMMLIIEPRMLNKSWACTSVSVADIFNFVENYYKKNFCSETPSKDQFELHDVKSSVLKVWGLNHSINSVEWFKYNDLNSKSFTELKKSSYAISKLSSSENT